MYKFTYYLKDGKSKKLSKNIIGKIYSYINIWLMKISGGFFYRGYIIAIIYELSQHIHRIYFFRRMTIYIFLVIGRIYPRRIFGVC